MCTYEYKKEKKNDKKEKSVRDISEFKKEKKKWIDNSMCVCVCVCEEYPGYDTKLHLMVWLLFWITGSGGVSFHYYSSQVHSGLV